MSLTYQDMRILEMRALIETLTRAAKDILSYPQTAAPVTIRENLENAAKRGQAYLDMLKKGDS